jgi:hypothetical protein
VSVIAVIDAAVRQAGDVVILVEDAVVAAANKPTVTWFI